MMPIYVKENIAFIFYWETQAKHWNIYIWTNLDTSDRFFFFHFHKYLAQRLNEGGKLSVVLYHTLHRECTTHHIPCKRVAGPKLGSINFVCRHLRINKVEDYLDFCEGPFILYSGVKAVMRQIGEKLYRFCHVLGAMILAK